MSRREVAARVAARYPHRALRGYVYWKVRTDPAYEAVAGVLRDRARVILDIGCGVGALGFYLRESGITAPVRGIDFDERKVAIGNLAGHADSDVSSSIGDARASLGTGHDVVLLDVLQYVSAAERQSILAAAARSASGGGLVVIRTGVRDTTWRYRVTWFVDTFARWSRWMRAERIEFPTREAIAGAFPGFACEVRPLWGRTPFNNYLFVFRSSETIPELT